MTVQYMYSPTGGLAGMPASASKKYQVALDPEKDVQEEWDIPYADGENYQNLEGFRIVLNPKPLNAFLINPKLADEMTDNPDSEKVKDAIENDVFTIDTNKTVYWYQEKGMNPPKEGEELPIGDIYKNSYSTIYNEAWDSSRQITKEDNRLYLASASSKTTPKYQGANPLSDPKLTVTIPKEKIANILKELEEIAKEKDENKKIERQQKLDEELTITVYYRRNVGFYTINHWVFNVPIENQTSSDVKYKDGKTYYKVLNESKQGRIGAMTNAMSGTDLMERAGSENWISDGKFDFTPYVTEGFAQQIIKHNNETTIDIYYTSASEYRIIFNTDDTYIPRIQANLNDTLIFDYSKNSLDRQDATGANYEGNNSYKNPVRTGYKFDGWKYEVIENSGLPEAYKDESTGKYYVNISENDGTSKGIFTIEDANKAVLVLANDSNSTVKAIHLYPRWSPADTSVRVVFWSEKLSGGEKDVDVDIENAQGNYEKRIGNYLNGTPNKVGENFSNVGSFTFTATSEQELNLSIKDNKITNPSSESSTIFTVRDNPEIKGDLASIINEMFEKKMPLIETAMHDVDTNNDIASSKLYYPYQINKKEEDTLKVSADGSTVINVYYALNVYSIDFTYYGKVNGTESIALDTVGYSLAQGSDRNTTNFANDCNKGRWASKNNSATWSVPQKITIKAKYGADIREVWPRSDGEQIDLSNNTTATQISWATTIGKYNDKFRYERSQGRNGESTLMGIYSAMSADIIANIDNTNETHHMYAYWWNGAYSYYRFNHYYEVPNLTIEEVKQASKIYDLANRRFDKSQNAQEMTSLNEQEKTRRDSIYLVDINGPLKDYFADYAKVLLKVNEEGMVDQNGKYYAVRLYNYQEQGKKENRLYALARQVNAPSTNIIKEQNPSARMHMTRANTIADHNTKAKDENGSYTKPIGSANAPYDLFFYYNRDRFIITYMVPARESVTGEYTLGTTIAPFGSSLHRYKINFTNDEKKLYNNDEKYKNVWTPSNTNTGLDTNNGYVRVIPDSAEDGTGIWNFAGWALDRAATSMVSNETWENESMAGNLRLFAIWDSPNYQVTFKMNGGTLPNGLSDDVVYQNVPANLGFTSSKNPIPRPTKNGYILSGWDWYKEDGTKIEPNFTFETPITENMIVKAKWTTFASESYSYKIWYLTNDPEVKNEVTNDFSQEKVPSAGLKNLHDYTKVLGVEFYENQQYPKGTSLLLGAKSFDGYIPYNGNATISLQESNSDATKENTEYVTYFYYNKAPIKKYEIRFQTINRNDGSEEALIPDIKETGQTDKAYFTPSSENVKILNEAGYQLVQLDADGNVIMENGKPKQAKSFADIKDYIDSSNQKFKDKTDESPMIVTFKVMPISYTIDYKIGILKDNDTETLINKGDNIDESTLVGAMQIAINDLAGGDVKEAVSKGKNPTSYDVTYFKENSSIKISSPLYVKNPESDKEEWWKFTGWSLGENTTEITTRATNKEYANLEIEDSIGNLVFLSNWEKIEKELTITNEVITNNKVSLPDEEFEYTITFPEQNSLEDLLIYKKNKEGKIEQFPSSKTNTITFKLKNQETLNISGISKDYTIIQNINNTMFDKQKTNLLI